jgi:hypothetical protein
MFVFRAFRAFRLSALKNKNSALFAPPRAKKILLCAETRRTQRNLSASRINIEIETSIFFNAESAEGLKERKFFNVHFPRIPRFQSFRVKK